MELSKESIEIVLREIVDKFLIPRFISLGMNASGRWINALDVNYDGNGYILGEDYTQYLVEGRPGGTMPPIQVLEEWVKVKLGLSGQEARNAAWAIGIKIKQEGTEYYPNGTDLLEILQSKEVTDYFNERVSGFLLTQAQVQFENVFKNLNK